MSIFELEFGKHVLTPIAKVCRNIRATSFHASRLQLMKPSRILISCGKYINTVSTPYTYAQ